MRILVIGAGRPLGAKIALNFAEAGHKVVATRRGPSGEDWALEAAGVRLRTLDLQDTEALLRLAVDADRAVLTPILTLSAPAAVQLAQAGMVRGVVFSSNNAAIVEKDPVYDGIRASEAEMAQHAPGWTVLRPTMIYGHPGDQNLSKLLNWLKKWPVFPFPGSGHALQQPVHYEDLARAAALLATEHDSLTGIVPYGGPATVPYQAVLNEARGVVGSGALILPIPTALVSVPAKLLAAVGLSPVSKAQLARVDRDKHVREARELPIALQPVISLREGLQGLAGEMGITPPDR